MHDFIEGSSLIGLDSLINQSRYPILIFMRFMKTPICFLLVIFSLTLQRFIINEIHIGSCEFPIVLGRFIEPNKCYANSHRIKFIHESEEGYKVGDYCDQTCSTCRDWKEIKYECERGPGYTTHRFGPIRGIRAKGFAFQEYFESSTCEESHELTGSFYLDELCEPMSKIQNNKTLFSSAKMGWDERTNGILYQEYDGPECKGRLTFTEVLPTNRCVKPRGYPDFRRFKFRKN